MRNLRFRKVKLSEYLENLKNLPSMAVEKYEKEEGLN